MLHPWFYPKVNPPLSLKKKNDNQRITEIQKKRGNRNELKALWTYCNTALRLVALWDDKQQLHIITVSKNIYINLFPLFFLQSHHHTLRTHRPAINQTHVPPITAPIGRRVRKGPAPSGQSCSFWRQRWGAGRARWRRRRWRGPPPGGRGGAGRRGLLAAVEDGETAAP